MPRTGTPNPTSASSTACARRMLVNSLEPARRGTCVAALTVPYLPQKHARFDRKTVLVAAQAAALEISRGLGAAEDVLSGSASSRR